MEHTLILAITGVLLMPCLIAGLVCTTILPRYVDPTKLEKEDSNSFARLPLNPWLPRRCYTTTGEKLWLVRNYLLGVFLVLGIINLVAQG